jgi:hypothetical protein
MAYNKDFVIATQTTATWWNRDWKGKLKNINEI